ncbi:MAG: 6-carboxytetrahydropterin synthase [Thermoguttaceae bacterium]|nr:6-carboxytetrahydropterin synthase [Thermoguttaceae bacterium]
MFSVARDFSFSYGHRLYRYDGKCRRLHGHNAKARVEIVVDSLNEQGMALDFVDLKAIVGTWIDETLDHRLFLAKDDPLAEILTAAGEPVLLFDENPTAERLAKAIYEYVEAQGFVVAKVEFWETENCRATYFRAANE